MFPQTELPASTTRLNTARNQAPQPLKAAVERSILLWEWGAFSVLFLCKILTDLVFLKFQASELTFDNIDYLDHAKQYFYAKDPVAFYQAFLGSFGKLRSPFQSLLIYFGKLACPKLSFGTLAYLIQAVSLFALIAASLTLAKRIARVLQIRWQSAASILVITAILFAPLSVGLSRGALVEITLAACMQLFVLLCCRLAHKPTGVDVCYLNLVFAWGILTKFTFPAYVALPLLILCVVALVRLRIAVLALSILFQILVQVGFCYNIVNFKPMLDNAHIQASLTSYGYLVPIWWEMVASGIGLPLAALFLGLLAYLGVVLARQRRPLWSPGRLRTFPVLSFFREGGAELEKIVLSAAAINYVGMFLVHLHATNRMVRFFYFVVPPLACAAALLLSKLSLNRRWRTGLVSGFVASSTAICLLFSIPTKYTTCSHPLISTIFNVDCFSADPVDGAMYAPHTANYHAFEIVHLLERRIPSGSGVLMVNPNEYFNQLTLLYHVRDTAALQNFYFGVAVVGVTELRNNDYSLWKDVKAIVVKNFTTDRYDTLVGNGAPPLRLSAAEAAKDNRLVADELARLNAKQIYRQTNSDGVVSVYLVK